MKTVAACNEIASDVMGLSVLRVTDPRLGAGEIIGRDGVSSEDELGVGAEAGGNQILRDLGLAINGDRSACEPLQIDMRISSVENEIEPVMGERLAAHPIGNPEIGRASC